MNQYQKKNLEFMETNLEAFQKKQERKCVSNQKQQPNSVFCLKLEAWVAENYCENQCQKRKET